MGALGEVGVVAGRELAWPDLPGAEGVSVGSKRGSESRDVYFSITK